MHDTYDSKDAVGLTGTTYRQLTYWTSNGYLPGVLSVGSGKSMSLTQEQLDHLTVMSDLVKHGVQPPTASALATALCSFQSIALGRYALVTPPPPEDEDDDTTESEATDGR
jgi:hypothetical protein